MRRVAVIQARMTSRRLPGKVLAPISGRPMLVQQIRRVRQCKWMDDVVVATSTNPDDDPIAAVARTTGVACFRGSEANVLARVAGAARMTGAGVVVRMTADCPLIDPEVAGRVVRELTESVDPVDYVSNVEPRTFPRGLDVEALFDDVLYRLERLARSEAAREHVTVYARAERPDLFLSRSVVDEEDNSDLRWTVDAPSDLAFVRTLYDELQLDSEAVPYRRIVEFVRARPDLIEMNAAVQTWNPH